MSSKYLFIVLVMVIGLGVAGYLYASWNASIGITKPCIEVLYSSPELNTSAAPYETIYVSSKGLVELEAMPTAYKLFKIKLNSDKVNITLRISIENADKTNLFFWITKKDLDPNTLNLYYEAVKIEPVNNTATITLEKTSSIEYYVWLDGTIRTSLEGETRIKIELYAEPLP